MEKWNPYFTQSEETSESTERFESTRAHIGERAEFMTAAARMMSASLESAFIPSKDYEDVLLGSEGMKVMLETGMSDAELFDLVRRVRPNAPIDTVLMNLTQALYERGQVDIAKARFLQCLDVRIQKEGGALDLDADMGVLMATELRIKWTNWRAKVDLDTQDVVMVRLALAADRNGAPKEEKIFEEYLSNSAGLEIVKQKLQQSEAYFERGERDRAEERIADVWLFIDQQRYQQGNVALYPMILALSAHFLKQRDPDAAQEAMRMVDLSNVFLPNLSEDSRATFFRFGKDAGALGFTEISRSVQEMLHETIQKRWERDSNREGLWEVLEFQDSERITREIQSELKRMSREEGYPPVIIKAWVKFSEELQLAGWEREGRWVYQEALNYFRTNTGIVNDPGRKELALRESLIPMQQRLGNTAEVRRLLEEFLLIPRESMANMHDPQRMMGIMREIGAMDLVDQFVAILPRKDRERSFEAAALAHMDQGETSTSPLSDAEIAQSLEVILTQKDSTALRSLGCAVGRAQRAEVLRIFDEQGAGDGARLIFDLGYIDGHYLSESEQKELFGKWSEVFRSAVKNSDREMSFYRMTEEILHRLAKPEELKRLYVAEGKMLKKADVNLPRVAYATLRTEAPGSGFETMRMSAKMSDRVFRWFVKELTRTDALPDYAYRLIQYAGDRAYPQQENEERDLARKNIQALKRLIEERPYHARNALEVLDHLKNRTWETDDLSEELPTVMDAIDELGSLTPTLYELYKKGSPGERQKLGEKIRRLRLQFYRNQPVQEMLTEEDRPLLAELIMTCFRPPGMSFLLVKELLNSGVKDLTEHVAHLTFPEAGYEVELTSVTHQLKRNEQEDRQIEERVRLLVNAKPEWEGERKNFLKLVQDLAKGKSAFTDEEMRTLLRPLTATPRGKSVLEKLNRAAIDPELRYQRLSEASELLGLVVKDEWPVLVRAELDALKKDPEFVQANSKILAGVEQAFGDTKKLQVIQKQLGKDRTPIDLAQDGAGFRLLAEVFSVQSLKTARQGLSKEIKKYEVSREETKSEVGEEAQSQAYRLYVSKNAASFFAKAAAGICTAQDIRLWDREDHFHLNLVDAKGDIAANIQAYLIPEPNNPGKQSVVLRGFNPTVAAMKGLDIASFCREVIAKAKQLAADSGLVNVYLSEGLEGWHALSNRDEIQNYLVRTYCRADREVPISLVISGSQTEIKKMYRLT